MHSAGVCVCVRQMCTKKWDKYDTTLLKVSYNFLICKKLQIKYFIILKSLLWWS